MQSMLVSMATNKCIIPPPLAAPHLALGHPSRHPASTGRSAQADTRCGSVLGWGEAAGARLSIIVLMSSPDVGDRVRAGQAHQTRGRMATKGFAEAVPLKMTWNLDNLEIKTWGVENALKPIIKNIMSLVNNKQKVRRKKGCSKKSSALVMALEVATANFVEMGLIIARENKEASEDILTVVEDIRKHGHNLILTSRDFTGDPCSSVRRGQMVRSAQELLSSVARLLILADMLDVHVLLMRVDQAKQDLEFMAGVSSQKQLMEGMRRLEASVTSLSQLAHIRQREVKDPELKDGLAAARAVLVRGSPMLLSSCNVSVRYPDMALAKQNRDNIHRQMCSAVESIHDIVSGKYSSEHKEQQTEDTLSQMLRRVLESIKINKTTCITEVETRKEIETTVRLIKREEGFYNIFPVD